MAVFVLMLMIVMMLMLMLMMMLVLVMMFVVVVMFVNMFMDFFRGAICRRDVLRDFLGPADDDGNMAACDSAFLCAAENHFDTRNQISGSLDHFSRIVQEIQKGCAEHIAGCTHIALKKKGFHLRSPK